jgi:hypothetical protein
LPKQGKLPHNLLRYVGEHFGMACRENAPYFLTKTNQDFKIIYISAKFDKTDKQNKSILLLTRKLAYL